MKRILTTFILIATGLPLVACTGSTPTPCYTVQDARRHVRPCHPSIPSTTAPTTTAPTTPPTTAVPTTEPTTVPTTTAPTTVPTTEPVAQPLGPVSPTGAWSVVMSDDFTTLDTDKWVVQNDRDMNGSHSRTGNVTVADGHLKLQLSEENGTTYGAVIGSNTDYWPDPDRYLVKVGDVVEARLFFPGSATSEVVNWGGFWTSGVDWPQSGENDIFEGGPGVSVNYHGVVSVAGGQLDHYADNGDPAVGAGTWGGRWVTATLYRAPDGRSEVYYDGQLVRVMNSADHERDGSEQTVLFTLGVSDQEKVLGSPGALLVDWFRAYRPA